MWVFTKDGFFSVVQKKKQQKAAKTSLYKGEEKVTVRSRERQDIVNLIRKVKESGRRYRIQADVGTDYEFRVTLPKWVFSAYLGHAAMNINYDNFKNEIGLASHGRATKYMKIWAAMLPSRPEIKMDKNYFLNYDRGRLTPDI
jgi:hypothetical protein